MCIFLLIFLEIFSKNYITGLTRINKQYATVGRRYGEKNSWQ